MGDISGIAQRQVFIQMQVDPGDHAVDAAVTLRIVARWAQVAGSDGGEIGAAASEFLKDVEQPRQAPERCGLGQAGQARSDSRLRLPGDPQALSGAGRQRAQGSEFRQHQLG